ncbi:MAG: signal peptidase II [Deltaproteobacteria bacterium]|nr:signal peptidase II [Deltaproteobacteria bacterium]
MNKWAHIGLVAAGLTLADQIIKLGVTQWLAPVGQVSVIPGFFNLTFVQNTGVAFGMFAGSHSTLRLLMMAALALSALAVILFFIHNSGDNEPLFLWGLSFICGGALGNQVDRIHNSGAVVDFLDFYLGSFHWPVFNLADIGITTGTALIILHLWRNR